MIEQKLLRNDLDFVAQQLSRRGFVFDKAPYAALEAERKSLQVATQDLQNEKNTSAKAIGKAKAQGQDIQPLLDQVASLGDRLKSAEARLEQIQKELDDIALGLPNIPSSDVPDGSSEKDNVEARRWGTVPEFDFEPKDHVDLGEGLGQLSFETAVKITGSRFSLMTGAIARLHRALAQFMLDLHSREHGYTEVYVLPAV